MGIEDAREKEEPPLFTPKEIQKEMVRLASEMPRGRVLPALPLVFRNWKLSDAPGTFSRWFWSQWARDRRS